MEGIYRFDFAILDSLQTIHTHLLNVIMSFFTLIGEGGLIWIATAIILSVIKKTRVTGWAMMQALVFEGLVNEVIIKHLVKRPRPFTLRPEIDTIVNRPSSYSFMSGHTCTSFACSTVIFCFNKKLGIIAYIVSALIGFSRNYFFIHYPTDVICGAISGTLLGLLAVVFVKYLNEKLFSKKKVTAPPEE